MGIEARMLRYGALAGLLIIIIGIALKTVFKNLSLILMLGALTLVITPTITLSYIVFNALKHRLKLRFIGGVLTILIILISIILALFHS